MALCADGSRIRGTALLQLAVRRSPSSQGNGAFAQKVQKKKGSFQDEAVSKAGLG